MTQVIDNSDVNRVAFLFAANVLEGVAVKVVGRRPDEPGELVALTNEAIIFYVDVAFLIGVDLSESDRNIIVNDHTLLGTANLYLFKSGHCEAAEGESRICGELILSEHKT